MKYKKHEHRYIKDKKNLSRIILEEREISIKRMENNHQVNVEKYGQHSDLIIIGENDRICGKEPQILEDELKKKSYLYGYLERGSRVLAGNFERGIHTCEEQRVFGASDFKNGLSDKNLGPLKSYPSYMEGRLYQMGKEAHNFAIKNNISLTDYINLIEIMCPEAKEPAFKFGYYEEEEKKSKYK